MNGKPGPQTLLRFYEQILLVRLCEERIQAEYMKDEMKTPVHLAIGAEAIGVGVVAALGGASKVFASYRNHAVYLAQTADVDGFFAELYGKSTGACKGKAGSMHLLLPESNLIATSAVVASTIPVATGAALAQQYQGKTEPVCVFFGDGAIEEGVFWESLNFTALKKLRILFVCEDNELAIHSPGRSRQGFKSLQQAVAGFDCFYAEADGSDVVQIHAATEKALLKMKEEPQPAILHFRYHRFLEHVGINEDYDKGYRQKPDNREQLFDPLFKIEQLLKENKLDTGGLRQKLLLKIDASIEKAKAAAFPSDEELYHHVYTEVLR